MEKQNEKVSGLDEWLWTFQGKADQVYIYAQICKQLEDS